MKIFFVVRWPKITQGSSRSVQFSHWLKYLDSEFTIIHDEFGDEHKGLFSGSEKNLISKVAHLGRRVLLRVLPVTVRFNDRKRCLTKIFFRDFKKASGSASAVLYTVSKPDAAHIAGLEIKRKTALPWAAFFSDPWTDSSYSVMRPADRYVQRAYERAVIEKADLLLFPTEELKEHFMRVHPGHRHKTGIVPHSFDPGLFPAVTEKSAEGRIRVQHIGNFYGLRNPFGLMDAFRDFLNEFPSKAELFRFEFTGRAPDGLESREESGVKNYFTFHPPVDYVEALKRMKEADCLLVVDAQTPENVYRPAKLVEYAGAGRLVWAVTPENSPTETFVKRLPDSLLSRPDDKAGFIRVFHELYERHVEKRLSSCHPPAWVYQEHAAALLVPEMEKKLKSLLEKMV